MKKIIIAISYLCFIVSLPSCSKFDDINTDPNATGTVTSSMLATNLILNITQASSAKSFLNPYMVSKHIAYAELAEGYVYNKFGRSGFDDMPVQTNIDKMISLSADVDKNGYTGLGLFIRAYKQFYTSLALGDIPYSEALKGGDGLIKPIYDTQKDVMLQVLKDLENADKAFASARNFLGDPTAFNGDVQKWRKIVNSFRLKVLMFLSKKVDDPDLKVKETFAAVMSLPILGSNSDNLQLVFSNKANQLYPFNLNIYRSYVCVSSVIIDSLKKLNDYRLFYYANPSSFAINTSGKSVSDWDAYTSIDPSMAFDQVKALNTAGKHCTFNSRYTDYEPGEPIIRVGYAEQNFIIAEAIVRGWISGNAKNYYENGVTAAMNFIISNTPDDVKYNHGRKMDATYIANYLTGTYVAFATNNTDQLKQIWQQKYILYFVQHPWDCYYENRRTGYPVMPINPSTTLNTDDPTSMPLRWMYSNDEYSYNKDNLKTALDRQYNGQDKTNGVMWILK